MNRQIRRVVFMGSKRLGYLILQEMFRHHPDRLAGAITLDDREDTRSYFQQIQAFAHTQKIPLFIAENKQHTREIIYRLKPDMGFVAGWYWLLDHELLQFVPHGFWGIHNSLLPRYRGSAPLVWAIINGETEVGFSIFKFTPGMDDGPIWAQEKLAISPDEYVGDILHRLEQKTLEVFQTKYPRVFEHEISAVEQDHRQATYCAQRRPEDGRIDWRRPAREIYNFIRAQSEPYPGAFTLLREKKLTIWKARLFEFPYFGTPGQVARITKDGVWVICGDQRALILTDISFDGSRTAPQQIIQSIKIRFP
ncbi:MAG: methionyl-tRNA formyltransferase [Calditrichaeota bacterium]|nr:MAG: methionyl-tRNA formyltransferase [Calditrichota bacterium]